MIRDDGTAKKTPPRFQTSRPSHELTFSCYKKLPPSQRSHTSCSHRARSRPKTTQLRSLLCDNARARHVLMSLADVNTKFQTSSRKAIRLRRGNG